MGMTLEYLRGRVADMRKDGFTGLTVRHDGVDMQPAFVVVCGSFAVPRDQPGFIGVEHYVADCAMPGEVGCLGAFRFIVDESVTSPAFLRSPKAYALYPVFTTETPSEAAPRGVVTTQVNMFHPDDGYDLFVTADYDRQEAYAYLQNADGRTPQTMQRIPYGLYAELVAFSKDPLRSAAPYRRLEDK